MSIIKNEVVEFYSGWVSKSDVERFGHITEITTPKTIEKTHLMVLVDRKLTVREILEALSISRAPVFRF